MKNIYHALLFTICLSGMVFSQIRWQTTHDGRASGDCKLESNKIKMTIHPFHIDVEEEAVIATRGRVSWGDPSTLEIFGEFTLTPGSAVRSMLLWNGNEILKAKLKDKTAADSAYEEVVDRMKPQPVVRDPALIEYVGQNTYRFKIYPVAIDASRKIRILYTIPLQAFDTGPQFTIHTAFTVGAKETPTQIPVEIHRGNTTYQYILHHGDFKKTIQFGSTYIFPHKSFFNRTYYGSTTPKAIRIVPDSTSWNQAYISEVASGKRAGHYTAISAAVPETLKTFAKSMELENYTFETKVVTESKSYIADIPHDGCFGIYLKSMKPWDKTIHWTIFDSNGNIALQYQQTIQPDTSAVYNTILPLLWGAKYTLKEGLGDLGALYGFVDSKMSLLALEEDVLPDEEALQWVNGGVPPLLPDEIIIDPSDVPNAPDEKIIYEFYTPVLHAQNDIAEGMYIQLLANGLVVLNVNDLSITNITIDLYDLSGRLIHSWRNVGIQNGAVRITMPKGARGTYILRALAGKKLLQKKIILK